MHIKVLLLLAPLTLSACSTTPTLSFAPATVAAEPPTSSASAAQDNHLTLNQIMADPEWIGRFAQQPSWQADGRGILFSRQQAETELQQRYRIDLGNAQTIERLDAAQTTLFNQGDAVLSRDQRYAAYLIDGNLYLKTLASGEVRALNHDGNAAQPQFLQSGELAYRQADRWLAYQLDSGITRVLAHWAFASDPLTQLQPKDYLAREQQTLIQYIDKQQRSKRARIEQQLQISARDPLLAPPTWYLDKGFELRASVLSADGNKLLIAAVKPASDDGLNNIMPNYISASGHPEAVPARVRAHDAKPDELAMWLLHLDSGDQVKLDSSFLPGIGDDPYAAVKADNQQQLGSDYQAPAPQPRALELMADWYWSGSPIQWSPDSQRLVIMLESFDHKDRWLTEADLGSGRLRSLHRLHDEAWVNYKFNDFGWFNHTSQLYLLSEQSGYAHLYLLDSDGQLQQLTDGAFEVNQPQLSSDDNYIYFKANIHHPGQYDIFRYVVAEQRIEQLSSLGGMTDYLLSPQQDQLLLIHSSLTRPPELYLQAASPAAEAKPLTHYVSEQFASIHWQAPQILALPSPHSAQPIYAKIYYPAGFDAERAETYPAVIFNHGAGYLQNSHFGWSGYFREFMFHNLLAEQGYVVMDLDYRASAGYGRNWRTAIYRNMGHPEIDDLAVAVNWMGQNAHVDPQRVGTYGGSYGGFMTFMALFTQPDLFACGAALRPVTDWAYYNYPYTGNILNTPQVDPLAYRRSSPIYHAEGLSKPLLINAPMVDDNVFFQDVVRLVQRLIELEKTDFETAIYPVERHGFRQPSSWLDEYRRIYKLFETQLK